jgi:hypothetical protein
LKSDREFDVPRERHTSIELSDEMIKAGFVFRQPCTVDENSSEVLKQKQALAEKLCESAIMIDLRKKDEKSKNKSIKKISKKHHTISNKPAVADVQKEL